MLQENTKVIGTVNTDMQLGQANGTIVALSPEVISYCTKYACMGIEPPESETMEEVLEAMKKRYL